MLTMRVLLIIVVMVLNVSGDNISAVTKLVSKPAGWVGLGTDHKITRRKADNHNHNGYAAPVATSYGSPAAAVSNSYGSPGAVAAAAENPVDLHNKEFCVDVSTYQPVVWVERDGEECKTDFVKQCEDKSENVCAEVTETKCEVSLYN
jgi:hypothetical protein